MINKNFRRDWNIYSGEINVIDSKHFNLNIDKDYISFSISLSFKLRLLYIAFLCFVIRIY